MNTPTPTPSGQPAHTGQVDAGFDQMQRLQALKAQMQEVHAQLEYVRLLLRLQGPFKV